MQLKYIKSKCMRGVAALGAALMLLQAPLGHLTVWAAASDEESVNTVSDNSVVSGNAVQGNLLLNYAYIENAQLAAMQQQNILISAGEGDIVWDDAALTLEHEAGGEKKQIALTDSSDNVLRFAVDTAGFNAGVYRIEKVTYSYFEDETVKYGEFVFADIPDMENVCFGLGVDNPLSETDFTQYDADGNQVSAGAEGLLDVNVVSLEGADENSETTEKIAHAVEQAQVQAIAGEVAVAETGMGDIPISDETVTPDGKVAGSLVVMLDPGHDATHAGARANGLEEEELTLKVAKYCKEYLEDTYTDVVVYMSRPGEACPYPGTNSGDCNAARVTDAYNKNADVYVSFHFNSTATSSTTATGAMVFYPNSNYKNDVGSAGATLASKIIEQLEKIGLYNNGIKIRNSENNTLYPDGTLADYYGVIRLAKEKGIPAVIIEHAFLNNAADAAFLKDEDNLKKMGIADALGIAKAYKLSTEEVEYDAEDLQVTDIDGANGTFKITLSGATPVKRIADIKFKVYPTEAKDKVYTYTAELVDEKTGTYSVTGNVGEHGKKEGKYKVIAYAYNAAGRKTQLRSTTFTIEKGKVDASGVSVTSKVSATEKTVTLKLKGNPNASGVYFRVYSVKNGTDDVKTYHATRLDNGDWKAKVTVSKHKNAGAYKVVAYSKGYFGTKNKVATGSFKIVGPTVSSAKVYKKDLNKGTFQVRVYDVASASGVKKVQIKVKNLDGKKKTKTYTLKKHKKGFYYADVNMKNHGYAYGDYKIEVIVSDKNGFNETVNTFTKTFEKPEPVISAKLKSKHTKLALTASGLGMSANVKAVKFRVYNTANASKKKYYTAKKSANGTWTATLKVSDFGTAGTYKVLVYVKGADGKYVKQNQSAKIKVPDIEGGKVKVKKKTDSASYLYVSGISYKGAVKDVQVKVWPATNSKAKYVYNASLRSDGSYRVTVNSKNHKGIGGKYKYSVTVISKNGIKKVLLKGTLTLGESTADTGELYAISGASNVTVAQMMAYYKKSATYPAFYAGSDAPTLKKFCQLYYAECEKEGIRAEVAFAQAMHETNFLRYGGDVDISQYNFAGIGATGGGVKGNSFATVRLGIRAQVQHLKAYANSEALNQTCVDPRFQYVQRGCAPYVEWLSIPNNPYGKGWATSSHYGSALRRMISAMRDC